jgi:putative ABC transport system ATP-binding protein
MSKAAAVGAPSSPDPNRSCPQGQKPLVLELQAVTKVYASRPPVTALKEVSLSITEGELLGIVGPSGSGKSTLLHLMGTIDRPSTGRVLLTGLDIAALSDRELAVARATRVGFIFQQFFLSEHQSALDNVADGLLYAGIGLRERREAASLALDHVGLGMRLAARPTQLSGGERQRVAIARALAGNPAIVLADEPTGNLDSSTGQYILGLLADLHAAGVTIAVITHDKNIADRMPRRVELLDGCIVADSGQAPGTGRLLPVGGQR